MKIVNIIFTSQNGGVEQVFIDYLSVLKNLGHEVLAIVKSDAPYAEKVEELGITVEKIQNNFGDHDFLAVSKIQKILEKFDADIVFCHIGRAMVLARKAIKKTNKKILLAAVNHSMNVKRSIGSDIVISVNREIFFRTVDLGQNPERSFIIHNAVDLSNAILENPQIDLSKKDVITLGVMGRLDEGKGFDCAIKAIGKLKKISEEKQVNKKFVLKISGSGKQEQLLRDLTKELNLENEVEFLGWIKDKKLFFAEIDIFCMSSQAETFSLVLLEAMKYRKPVISTDVHGPKEIIRDGVDGLLIKLKPFENLEERIVEAVIKMTREPDLVKKIIENSFLRLVEKFSYKSLEKNLSEIVGKGS